MKKLQRKHRDRGFTLIEMLIAVSVVGVLASIVVIAINPRAQLGAASDVERRQTANQIEKALVQRLIQQGSFPSSANIPSGQANRKQICRLGGSATDTGCVSFDPLVTENFLVTLTPDALEPCTTRLGYEVYQEGSFVRVSPRHLGKRSGDAIDNSSCPIGIPTHDMALWWKADGILYQNANGTTVVAANADPVGYATDYSSTNNHITQPVAASRPTYRTNVQNGLPAVRFVYYPATPMTSLLTVPTNSLYVFWVGKMSNPIGQMAGSAMTTAVSGNNLSNGDVVMGTIGTGQTQGLLVTSAGSQVATSPGAYQATWHMFEQDHTGTNIIIRIDGSQVASTAIAGSRAGVSKVLIVGGQDSGTNALAADLGEMLVYTSALSAGEIAQVENYLKGKWGTP